MVFCPIVSLCTVLHAWPSEAIGSSGMELQMVVSHHVDVGNGASSRAFKFLGRMLLWEPRLVSTFDFPASAFSVLRLQVFITMPGFQ